jgi:hypothetical protein
MRRWGAVAAVCAAVALGAAAPAHAAPRGPWPVTVTVQTVPALRDVHLTFDGMRITTDAAGRASYTGMHDFSGHALTLVDTAIDTPHRHYRFARWSGQRDPDQAFRTSVQGLPLRANYTVTAAFTARFPITASVTDQHGKPIAADRVSEVTVRSDAGSSRRIPVGRTVWLDGLLPVYRKSVLTTRTISYSLQSVVVGGTNTVDAGKQRFTPARTGKAVFIAQFHDLTVTAHDAMLSGRSGSAAEVTMPDGTVRTVPFGPDRTATLRGLPRGHYHVDVRAGGVTSGQELRLSKDRAVDIEVLSRWDLAVFVAAALVTAVGLVVAGRAAARRPPRVKDGQDSKDPKGVTVP